MSKVKCCIVYKEDSNDPFAFFPEENFYDDDSEFRRAYCKVWQHAGCGTGYFKQCKDATFPQAYGLYKELTEQVGYDLEMIDMDEALEIINGE